MKWSPASSAVVRSEARSLPDPGSEYPWHQNSSALRIFGRKRVFCASVPKLMINGPTIPKPKTESGGAPASSISSAKMKRRAASQPVPPSSAGQWGATQPFS
jgi:hypothetical protein